MEVTTNSGCKGISEPFLAVVSGLPDHVVHLLKIFPNPFKNVVTVSFELDSKQAMRIEVINSVGAVVYSEQKEERGMVRKELQLDHLASGVYAIRLSYDKYSETRLLKKD